MSDTSVHTILSAITEAKSALDREPEYKSRITELERSHEDLSRHSQTLELRIVDYKRTIDELQSKVRSLEVERDDASFRLLEAEDKLLAYANLCEVFSSNAKRLAPVEPTPEPMKPTVVEPSFNEVKEAAKPEYDWMDKDGNVGHNEVVPMQPPHPLEVVGQSESPLPQSSALSTDQNPSVNESATSTDAAPSPKPYSGKTYSDVFGSGPGCALEDWQKGGGSDELYWK